MKYEAQNDASRAAANKTKPNGGRAMTTSKHPAAVALGKLGGAKKSTAKSAAVRANGKLGGRPRKEPDAKPR